MIYAMVILAALLNAPPAFNPPTDGALQTAIGAMDQKYPKKGALITKARAQLAGPIFDHELAAMQVVPCPNPNDFILSSTQIPSYFQNPLRSGPSTATYTPNFYSYSPCSPNFKQFWVDFANRTLGGGCFTEGFVQEEIMICEIPSFAAVIAANQDPKRPGWCALRTRVGGAASNRVLLGNPTPWLFEGITRTLNVVNCYGKQFDTFPLAQILMDALPVNEPNLNVLAMAAPRLYSNKLPEQTNLNTIRDLFNTAYAGFILARQSAAQDKKQCLINTGPIGAGLFDNNKIVVYLAQRLAAHQLDIAIAFYGYDSVEAQLGEKIFGELVQTTPPGASLSTALVNLQVLAGKEIH